MACATPKEKIYVEEQQQQQQQRQQQQQQQQQQHDPIWILNLARVVAKTFYSRLPRKLHDWSVRKIASLDTHVALACAGLKADARVLINRARVECQSHRLTVEAPVPVEYITRYIAGLQQKYTQSGGVRPFGLSTLIVGFDPYTDKPALYQTDPSGTFSAWKANATGRNSNSMREFLEKNYKDTSGKETIKLTIRALLEVVESGGKNIEIAVMTKKDGLRQLEETEIDEYVAEIEAEKAAAEAAKKSGPKDT
ncbi:Proteasome subunit alpha type-7-B [Triticum urartu]|uniref:Proteasome subunit alpha type-7-B n=1 Tax=Triticum urartu TaxID=4572 RepID=M7ZVD8_TRIUA|nr:Proteasome subunit alpha type-7-B [Triticum urartu]